MGCAVSVADPPTPTNTARPQRMHPADVESVRPRKPPSFRSATSSTLPAENDRLTDECEPVAPFTSNAVPPLRIVFLIVGSRGDVQPFIAFAMGLQKHGHKIRIATHACFRDFVTSHGIEYFPIGGDPAELMRFMAEHPDMITLNPMEIESKKRALLEIFMSCYVACTTSADGLSDTYLPDIIVANPPVQVHVYIAEKLHVPLQIMFTMPWSPNNEYPHPIANAATIALYGNRRSYTFVEDLLWIGVAPQINQFRKDALDFPAILNGWSGVIDSAVIPQTLCISPSLMPKPADYGSHIDVVGFWFLDSASSEEFDPAIKVPELLKFLNAGSPPLYIGFGSIVVDDPQSLSKRVVEGVRKSGVRAIVHQGWAKLGDGMVVGDNIFLLKDPVPHDWLFPLCSAVCHHGGAGTVAAGLKVGKPTIVVPFFADQPFWGQRIAQCGVGPAPIFHSRLTEDNFCEAILFCKRPEVIAAAEELGKTLREERGVENGIVAFESKLPMVDDKWMCKVYQNQRWHMGVGWTNPLSFAERNAYSDRSGRFTLDMEKFPLPENWSWDGPWDVSISPDTDEEGWQYAHNWSFPFHAKPALTDLVRRRKWLRTRTYNWPAHHHPRVNAQHQHQRYSKPPSSSPPIKLADPLPIDDLIPPPKDLNEASSSSAQEESGVAPRRRSSNTDHPTAPTAVRRLRPPPKPAASAPTEPLVPRTIAQNRIVYFSVVRASILKSWFPRRGPFLQMALLRDGKEIQCQRTKIVEYGLEPVFKQTLFFVYRPDDDIFFECRSWNMTVDFVLGRTQMSMCEFLRRLEANQECVLPLGGTHSCSHQAHSGSVHFALDSPKPVHK